MKVCLDPGHSVTHPGCSGHGLHEESLNLAIAERIGHYLRERGIETTFTRLANDVSISGRARWARVAKSDYFLSIHCDWSGSPKANGFTAYVAAGDQTGKAAATGILTRLRGYLESSRTDTNGVRWDNQSQYSRLGVLRGTYRHMPAVLLECGFLSNPIDALLLSNPRFVENIAQAIATEIKEQLGG